ncbi:MAG: cytochrome c oxidase subunit II [Anaerolineae bacterium]|nr:cytochrome c oxidase subunit II [Anaerolineae bacterium]
MMTRHGVSAFLLWLVLTAVGLWWAFTANLFPMAAAEEANIIDSAFRLLLILGMPITTLVLAVLFYSVIRFRARGEVTEDGPPLRTNRLITWAWFAVTSALAIYVIINPGLTGLAELSANPTESLVVQVEGQQWHWKVTYPQYNLNYDRALQVALPVNTRVKFEITSTDVIHSFWIPAFRMKMDAVPGKMAVMYVTPTETGAFEDDPNMRAQCAELCGTGHPNMNMNLLVLEPAQFEQWLAEAQMLTSN